MSKRSNGFTIVELLIVIVVISVLAAVTVVAYNGVQLRAYATKAASARSVYIRALKMYKTDNGKYPAVPTPLQTVCLGTAADYPASAGFASGQCRYSDYTSVNMSYDSGVTNALKQYATLPSLNWPAATEFYSGSGTDYYRGIFYVPDNAPGTGAYIWYYLPGSTTCGTDGYGGYNATTGETQCTVRLDV